MVNIDRTQSGCYDTPEVILQANHLSSKSDAHCKAINQPRLDQGVKFRNLQLPFLQWSMGWRRSKSGLSLWMGAKIVEGQRYHFQSCRPRASSQLDKGEASFDG
ncbi:hypothetical protein GJ744_011033 [Endocarpon pusillum]|uniref:Uncharacterized protein n=1 Tax=Endocarpon pusillum TaxID=364733 RepID=A0A8H7E1E5_9EURO|nr:hypothetical protein GJ744_011033 [Endocarpon pusillum]